MLPFDFIGIFPNPVISILVSLSTPASKNSSVELMSSNPLDPPKLNVGTYNNQQDLDTLVKGYF
jgi:hypothetical protein